MGNPATMYDSTRRLCVSRLETAWRQRSVTNPAVSTRNSTPDRLTLLAGSFPERMRETAHEPSPVRPCLLRSRLCLSRRLGARLALCAWHANAARLSVRGLLCVCRLGLPVIGTGLPADGLALYRYMTGTLLAATLSLWQTGGLGHTRGKSARHEHTRYMLRNQEPDARTPHWQPLNADPDADVQGRHDARLARRVRLT